MYTVLSLKDLAKQAVISKVRYIERELLHAHNTTTGCHQCMPHPSRHTCGMDYCNAHVIHTYSDPTLPDCNYN